MSREREEKTIRAMLAIYWRSISLYHPQRGRNVMHRQPQMPGRSAATLKTNPRLQIPDFPKGRHEPMILRNILEIDETKCDGCGLCVPACEEGAIRVVHGKARVVSETYCDGLGACLGHCPRGAISIVQRAAAPFDQAAVTGHLKAAKQVAAPAAARPSCPGATSLQLQVLSSASVAPCAGSSVLPSSVSRVNASQLANWPVQLHLLSPLAPYLRGADLLLVADCVPFACADFHARVLDGRPVAIGCPKLDDGPAYVQKLAQIVHLAHIRSITVVHMEVPCCTGLLRIAAAAVEQAAADIPVRSVMVTIRGQVAMPHS